MERHAEDIQPMDRITIPKEVSAKVIMSGDYYLNNHPGGISAVVKYWSERFEGLNYYPVFKSGGKITKGWWYVTSYARMALRMAWDRNVKIMHLHTAADGSFWRNADIVRLGRFFGRKVILHIHASRFKDFFNEASGLQKEKILDTLKSADRIIVLSQSWKEWFLSIGIESSALTVLPNITPEPTEIPSARVRDGKTRFLFLGEIGQRKGVFDIIRAIASHKNEAEGKIELKIGGNRNEDRLMEAIRKDGLENIVSFEGWASGEKKLRMLNWADVYILPSFNEGLPISILEAMSYGCPIISTEVGGIPEVVNGNGTLITPGNAEEIWDAMAGYIGNRDLIEKEGRISLENVRPYLPDNVMGCLKELYLDLLDVRR